MQALKSHSIDVILLCGGLGMRIRELTKDKIPKPLLKLAGKPLVTYSLDSLDPELIDRLIVTVSHQPDKIKSYFSTLKLPYEVVFSESELGVVTALQAALKCTKNATVVVCNSDEVRWGLSMRDIVEYHARNNNKATMAVTYEQNLFRHRVIHLNAESIIDSFTYKSPEYINNPEKQGLINTGFYVFEKDAEKFFDKHHSPDWSGIIDPLVEKRLMKAKIINTQYFNVGTQQEFNEATQFLASLNQTQ